MKTVHATARETVTRCAELLDVSELRRNLERAVARVCPAWLSAQRDDVVQCAVIRVIQMLEARSAQGDGRSAAEGNPPLTTSYLYKVAHSALVDEIRRFRRRRETGLEADAVVRIAAAAHDPERTAASMEIRCGIQRCLAHLKLERRLAVTLYLQGHTVAEAAQILEWPVKRTENLVYRGLADLRACLTSKGMRP